MAVADKKNIACPVILTLDIPKGGACYQRDARTQEGLAVSARSALPLATAGTQEPEFKPPTMWGEVWRGEVPSLKAKRGAGELVKKGFGVKVRSPLGSLGFAAYSSLRVLRRGLGNR